MRTTLRHSFLTASLALALGGYTLIASGNEADPSPRVLIEATGAALDATALRSVGLADSRALRAREIGFDAQALGATGRAPRRQLVGAEVSRDLSWLSDRRSSAS